MQLSATLESKVVDGAIVATIKVNASGGFGRRRAMEISFINTINDNASSVQVVGDGGEFEPTLRVIEAIINPYFGEGYHVYKAEVSVKRSGTTATTFVSNYVHAKRF